MTKETMVAFGVSEISADVYGFQALAKLHAQLESFDRYNISIDCSRLRWIDAQLGTCLLTMALVLKVNSFRYFVALVDV